MAIKPAVKANWIAHQKKYPYPVNAIGRRIALDDHKTLQVWREEGIAQFVKNDRPETALPTNGEVPLGTFALMSTFVELLVEELGVRGFGRDNLLQVIQHRLTRLRVKHPCLEGVTVVNDQVDFSALSSSPANLAEIINAWGELIKQIHQSGMDNLGQKVGDQKYRYVREALYQLVQLIT